jgi:hypothetical protein
MSRRAQDNLVALLVLGIFIAAIVAASGYGPRARLVPIPIAAIGAILIIAQLILQNFKSDKDLEIDLLEFISRRATGDHPELAVPSPDEPAEKTDGEAVWKRELAALGLVAALIGLFQLVGPLPAMFLFTSGYFIFSRFAGIAKGLLYGFAATAAVYALFYLWLGVDMRHGLIDLSFGLW